MTQFYIGAQRRHWHTSENGSRGPHTALLDHHGYPAQEMAA